MRICDHCPTNTPATTRVQLVSGDYAFDRPDEVDKTSLKLDLCAEHAAIAQRERRELLTRWAPNIANEK